MDTLTPAEVAQLLGTSPNRVRQLLRDRKLMAVPGSGNGKIPADFVQDGTSDAYVLCEINASSVLPFPPHAPKALALAVGSRVEPGSDLDIDPGLPGFDGRQDGAPT